MPTCKPPAIVDATTIEFSYQSAARAIAILDRAPSEPRDRRRARAAQLPALLLPRGQHVVTRQHARDIDRRLR